jgi:predicted N-acetyltransferase YhbS
MTTSSAGASEAETFPTRPASGSRVKAFWFERDSVAGRLDFGLATDRFTLDQAFRLQHDQYVAQGYMDTHPSHWRLSIYNALPCTRVFVARDDGRVVATMSVINDSRLSLPMAEIYTEELRRLRGEDRQLAEVSGLAVHPAYQKSGLAILLRLIRMVLIYSIETALVEDLCITVNPHHEAFYRKAFGFESMGGLKHYGKVNGAPALALRLDLDVLRGVIADLREGRPIDSEVYTFLFKPEAFEPALARLDADLTQAFPRLEDVRYFFSRHEAGTTMSPAVRAYIDWCWKSTEAADPRTLQVGMADDFAGAFEPDLALQLA